MGSHLRERRKNDGDETLADLARAPGGVYDGGMVIARALFKAALVAVFALPLAGCAGGHEALEKQVADLRGQVNKLKADKDALAERVDQLEIARGMFAKQAAPPPSAPTPGAPGKAPEPPPAKPHPPDASDKPDLEVVKLGPNEGDGDVDSDAPRPVIRSIGPGVIAGRGGAPKKKEAPKKGPK